MTDRPQQMSTKIREETILACLIAEMASGMVGARPEMFDFELAERVHSLIEEELSGD